MYNMHSKQL